MPGFNFAVHREILVGKGAEPNVVIPFAVPLKVTAVLCQYFTNFLSILRHG